MAHTVRTYDNQLPAKCYILAGVIQIDFVKQATGGPITATIKLDRRPGINYVGIWPGYYIEIVSDDGDVVWEGLITSIPETVSESGTFDITASGRLILLAAITGTWTPNYRTRTELKTIITDGINAAAPGITYTATSFPATGVGVVYAPQNTASVRNHLDELIKYGDSGQHTLFWQVINGVFTVFARPYPLTSYDYKVAIVDCAQAAIGVNNDTFYTRVSVRWKDAVKTYISPYNNSAMQSQYAMSFGTNNPSGTRLPYIKEPDVVDITGHGALTQAQADQIGNTLLNRYSSDGVRMTASKITIQDAQAIRDFGYGQVIGLSKILPAKTLLLTDVPGSSGLLGTSSSSMFIGEVHFTETYTEGVVHTQVELTSEDLINPANILAAFMALIPKEAA